jgi:hypothetical protein
MDGELTFWTHDQLVFEPVEVQLVQMPKLGGSKAYPVHPFWLCRS